MEVMLLQHQDRSFPSQGQASHPPPSFLGLGSMRVSHLLTSNPTFTSPKISPSYVLMGLFFSVPGCHPTTGSQKKPRPWAFLHEGKRGTLGSALLARAVAHSAQPRLFASHPRACPLCAWSQATALGSPCSSGKGNVFPFPSRPCSPAASESGFPCTLLPSASGTTGKCIKGLGKAVVRVTRSHSWIQLLL